jgi:para-nitrobenzyl esterase
MLRRCVVLPLLACVVALLAACGGGSSPATIGAQNSGAGATQSGGTSSGMLIQTTKGNVEGEVYDGTRLFLGIPYAADPTGALRFAPPQPRPAWSGTFQATKPGNICPQPASPLGALQTTTEDCLNLNVWTPQVAQGLPVMVWIHGGSWVYGSGVYYNASALVKTGNIIVVTLNYRLGAFGWLASSALDNGTGNTGNYGLEDVVAALQWVRTNIAAFGGNPNNVTIDGESAGGGNVCGLLAAPAAKGLFEKAIVESLPCATLFPSVTTEEAKGAAIATRVGCAGTSATVVSCLRNASVSTILNAENLDSSGALPFFPSAGGTDIPNQPRQYLGSVPTMLGGNHFEMLFFVDYPLILPPPTDPATYAASLGLYYDQNAAVVNAEYPSIDYSSPAIALAQATTDYNPLVPISLCADEVSWQIQAANGGSPMYAYEFNDPNAPPVLGQPGFPGGPVHASELLYLFPGISNSWPNQSPFVLSPESQALANQMQTYWTNFVRNGNPNGSGSSAWPVFATTTDAMQLAPGPGGVSPGVNVNTEHNCSFWENAALNYGDLNPNPVLAAPVH